MNSKEIKDAVNEEFSQVILQGLSSDRSDVKDGIGSGSLVLNEALSGSPFIGYAYGRIVEIFGAEQSGKTTLALHAVVEAQKKGLVVVYIDAEHALDPIYAKNVGVDLTNLLINQPDYGEQAIEVVRSSLRHGAKLVVVDSVAALTPRAEIEGATGDSFMGKQARLMGQAMRQLVSLTSKSKAILIFINQIRMKIGVVFGNPETTTGGKALKFYASYRLETRSPRGGAQRENDVSSGEKAEIGIVSKIKVVKNKLFSPFRTAEVLIRYGRGIDKYYDVASFLFKKEKGASRIRVKGKSYTKNQLISRLKRSQLFREEVKSIIKEGESK